MQASYRIFLIWQDAPVTIWLEPSIHLNFGICSEPWTAVGARWKMLTYWTNFMKTGDPNLPVKEGQALEGQSEWRPCTTDEVMRLE